MRPTPAPDAPALHIHAARAVEPLAAIGELFLQRRRHGDHLERGARLIRVGNQPVAHPLGERLNVVSRRIVRVVVRLVHHRQNLAGFGIHCQNAHALGAVDLHRLARGLLAVALYRRVNRQDGAAALKRLHIFPGGNVQRPTLAVDFLHNAAAAAAEIIVQRLFKPGLPHAVDRRETQKLRQERAVRVIALAVLLQIQPVELVRLPLRAVGHHQLQLLRRSVWQLALQRHAALRRVGRAPANGLRVHADHRRQQARQRFRVFHLPRADRQRVRRRAHGKHLAVAIENRPAPRLNHRLGRPLGLRLGLQRLRIDHRQHEQARGKPQKQQEKQTHAHGNAATNDRPRRNQFHPSPLV